MTFDIAVPEALKNTQKWFASIITRPMNDQSQMNPLSPTGTLMEQEACQYIVPSPTLLPAQRIELYNQQYWWRLLKTMQEVFPLLTRMFGYYDFNQLIAIPYLVKYPPRTWTLNNLGDRLAQWVMEEYHAADKTLIYHCAKMEWAFNIGFFAAETEAIDKSHDISSLADQRLCLQAHLYMCKLPYDLFAFRHTFIEQEPEYWVDHDFPELVHRPPGEYLYYVLYRNEKNQIVLEEMNSSEWQLLEKFTNGMTIDALCEWLCSQDNEKLTEDASQNLHLWFNHWTHRKWLTFAQKIQEKLPTTL